MEQKYRWDVIAADMERHYSRLLLAEQPMNALSI
jgi:hypothetical protein